MSKCIIIHHISKDAGTEQWLKPKTQISDKFN